VITVKEDGGVCATTISRYVEHDPEAGVAGHHAFVGLWGVFKRKQFDHWVTLLRPQFNQQMRPGPNLLPLPTSRDTKVNRRRTV
jgi:hypothetical protein